jgi:hypothetical protein
MQGILYAACYKRTWPPQTHALRFTYVPRTHHLVRCTDLEMFLSAVSLPIITKNGLRKIAANFRVREKQCQILMGTNMVGKDDLPGWRYVTFLTSVD